MLLRSVTFENFGIYGGVHSFDLTPDSADQFDRPIVLFSGKNGVGKTTFVEGIRLCLHGPVALGSRVGQQEYEEYLIQHVHRPAKATAPAASSAPSAVELAFDFTSVGRRQHYRVRRQWTVHSRRVQHELAIWENDDPLDRLAPEEREALLRDLVPPGLADIFFFDGEKVFALAKETADPRLLAETVNALLGLNLVDQLQRDLDTFLLRHGTEGARNGAHHELERLLGEQATLEERRADLDDHWRALRREIDEVRDQIGVLEGRIAAQGGHYPERRRKLNELEVQRNAEIEALRRQATEMAGGLLPFAFAPKMLEAVRSRLETERVYHEQEAARQLLGRQEALLRSMIGETAFWADTAAEIDLPVRDQILRQVVASLRDAALGDEIPAAEIILHVSDKERAQLAHWIDLALDETPLAFLGTIQAVRAFQAELDAIKEELNRIPAEDVLAPLVTELQELNRRFGALEHRLGMLDEETRSLGYSLEQNGHARRRAWATIEQGETAARRSTLAAATQRVLEEYKAALTRRKIALLEQSLVIHFNQLCRKHAFLDRVSVDPDTFAMTLHRAGHAFTRAQLSAGENQLLAIALLWALRELSGRATPVIIDTPLSRLDSQHRQSMLHDFLPHASHQVIVLATDAEIDAAALKRLAPAIARIYHMEYDPTTGATTHTAETPAVVTPNLALFEEMT